MRPRRFDILATDLDGTLLTADHRLPDRTIGRLREAQARGVTVILCSARQPQPIRVYRLQAGLEAPYIAYSGALILDHDDRELAYWPVPADVGAVVLDAVREIAPADEVSVYLYIREQWYVERIDEKVHIEAAANDGVVPIVTDDLSRAVLEGGGFAKTMLVGPHEKLETVRFALTRRLGSEIVCVPSQATHYEILHRDVSKGSAVAWLARRLDVDRERIIAIGDNFNDLPMFEVAGFSVAVANAPEAIRQRADLVVPSNLDQGACVAIDTLILNDSVPGGAAQGPDTSLSTERTGGS